MNTIKTKIITLFLCATVAFSAVGFSACGNSELEAKLAELEEQIAQQQEQIIELQEEIDLIKGQLNKNIIEQEVEDMIELTCWSPAVSSLGNRIMVNNSNENVVIECVTNKGYLIDGHEYVKQMEISSGKTIYWCEGEDDIIGGFVEIALRYEETYIGYALVKVYIESNSFNATVIKSVIFPMVDGEYQKISKQELKAKVNALIIQYEDVYE